MLTIKNIEKTKYKQIKSAGGKVVVHANKKQATNVSRRIEKIASHKQVKESLRKLASE